MNLINSDKQKYIKIISYLVCSLPVFIIFSRFVADLTVVTLSLLFLFICNKKELLKNRFILIAFIFILFSVISSLLSENIIISLKSSFLHIRFIFFILSVSLLVIFYKGNALRAFFYIFLACYLVLFLDATIQFIYKENILGYSVQPVTRVSSFFFDELILGSYLSRFFPLMFFLYFFLKLNINKYFILYFLIHLYFTVFITGERLSFLILNIYYLILMIFLFKKKISKIIFFFSSILCFIFIIVAASNFGARSSFDLIKSQSTNFNYFFCEETKKNIIAEPEIFKKWNQIINERKLQENINNNNNNYIPNCDPIITIKDINFYYIFSIMHFNHYLAAFEIFKDNKLFGIGPKNFRNICKNKKYFINEFSCSTHPHNYYIQLLSETGLPGFVMFLSLYVFFFYLFVSNIFKSNNDYFLTKHALICCFLINFFPLFPSGNFFNNWNAIVYTLPLGFLFGLFKKSN